MTPLSSKNKGKKPNENERAKTLIDQDAIGVRTSEDRDRDDSAAAANEPENARGAHKKLLNLNIPPAPPAKRRTRSQSRSGQSASTAPALAVASPTKEIIPTISNSVDKAVREAGTTPPAPPPTPPTPNFLPMIVERPEPPSTPATRGDNTISTNSPAAEDVGKAQDDNPFKKPHLYKSGALFELTFKGHRGSDVNEVVAASADVYKRGASYVGLIPDMLKACDEAYSPNKSRLSHLYRDVPRIDADENDALPAPPPMGIGKYRNILDGTANAMGFESYRYLPLEVKVRDGQEFFKGMLYADLADAGTAPVPVPQPAPAPAATAFPIMAPMPLPHHNTSLETSPPLAPPPLPQQDKERWFAHGNIDPSLTIDVEAMDVIAPSSATAHTPFTSGLIPPPAPAPQLQVDGFEMLNGPPSSPDGGNIHAEYNTSHSDTALLAWLSDQLSAPKRHIKCAELEDAWNRELIRREVVSKAKAKFGHSNGNYKIKEGPFKGTVFKMNTIQDVCLMRTTTYNNSKAGFKHAESVPSFGFKRWTAAITVPESERSEEQVEDAALFEDYGIGEFWTEAGNRYKAYRSKQRTHIEKDERQDKKNGKGKGKGKGGEKDKKKSKSRSKREREIQAESLAMFKAKKHSRDEEVGITKPARKKPRHASPSRPASDSSSESDSSSSSEESTSTSNSPSPVLIKHVKAGQSSHHRSEAREVTSDSLDSPTPKKKDKHRHHSRHGHSKQK